MSYEEKGRIVQVVYSTYALESDNGSTGWTDTGLTVDITPKYADSRVVVHVAQAWGCSGTSGVCSLRLTVNGAAVHTASQLVGDTGDYGAVFPITYTTTVTNTNTLTIKTQHVISVADGWSECQDHNATSSSIFAYEVKQ